ncbi:unnamed protein product, partial [Didymodactylos carnosus]
NQFAYYNYKIIRLIFQQSTLPAQFCAAGYKQTCFNYTDIYEQNYPFPPFEYLFSNVTKKHLTSSFYCNNTSSFYLCPTSHECISKYRLFDGFYDCIDRSDERNYLLISSLDKKYLRDRYRCETTPGLILPHFLGDKEKQCEDGSDEINSFMNWRFIVCTIKQFCTFLKQSLSERSKQLVLGFNHICDSRWDVQKGLDEINCTDWACGSDQIKYEREDVELWNGNCNKNVKKCDGIWDFIDGRDELNCTAEHSGYKIKSPPCRNITTKEIVDINSKWRLRGNVHVDCIGGQDERNTYACQDRLSLNTRFLCLNGTCIEQMYTCDGFKHCLEGEDEDFYLCANRSATLCPPAYRLARILHIDLRERRRLLRQVCSDQCLHGTCYPIINKESDYYCDCEIEWNGKNCDGSVLWNLSKNTLTNVSSTCANNSIYLPTFYDHNASKYTSFMCICPLNTWGATCNLKIPNQCSSSTFKCDNNGICLTFKDSSYKDRTTCQCPGNFYGDHCENPTRVVTIHKNEKFSNLSSTIFTAIVQLASVDFIRISFSIQQSILIVDDNPLITYELYSSNTIDELQAGFFKLYEEDNDGNYKSNIYLLHTREVSSS